jgi:tetratricopeptide (TPR) repeat protein
MVGDMARRKKKAEINPESCSLPELCALVADYIVPFEDVAEYIENKTYASCMDGGFSETLAELSKLAAFFEKMPEKNEENCRDLADVYILIGEMHQYVDKFQESIPWFKKAAIVFDRSALPYHDLATSYIKLKDAANAVRSLEQEISLEPGNYFSIFRLVDFYEQQGQFDKVEDRLESILDRNPDNLRALHRLIVYYEEKHPDVDVELMRRRLLAIDKDFNEIETLIRAYHLCRGNRISDAMDFANAMIGKSPTVSMFHLLKAYLFGEIHQFSRKRTELVEFKKNCYGKMKFIENKLEEFEHIFGKKATAHLEKALMISYAYY